MLNNVHYNRSQRVYEIFGRNQAVAVSIPCGRNGRKIAFQFAVLVKNSELHAVVTDWIQRYPAIDSRAWKAAEIVLSNDVMPCFSQQYAAVVASQSSEYGDYNIGLNDGVVTCECVDYYDFNAPMVGENFQPLCKHVLAFIFSEHLRVITA